jgi:hydrogenase/urease accessory protein HupE
MKRFAFWALTAILVASATPAAAHPAPFSYLDLHVGPGGVDVSLVAHIFDVSHDLHVEPQERLLDAAFLAQQSAAIAALLGSRLHLTADGVSLAPGPWSAAEALPDRQGIGIRTRFAFPHAPGVVALDAAMFPYDPAHQTFVNVYEGEALTLQAILDIGKTGLEYYPGSRQGMFAVARRFTPAGLRHVLLGPDHLLFLLGLLLLGGSLRQLALVAGAFVAGNAVALALTVLNVLHPPARIIEPAVALSLIYVGADNLMVRGGRDVRAWIALAFGVIHGFWFANGLREMDLPARALGWSLLSFDVGVEIAQVLVIVAVGSAISVIRGRYETAGRRLAYAGSLVVIAGGAYWFIQRVFFPGGIV